MHSKHRTITESALYTKQISQLGNVKDFDEALQGILWALSLNPGVFDQINGSASIRIAKTTGYRRNNIDLPPLRILFCIEDDDHVELLAIGVIPDEELSDF